MPDIISHNLYSLAHCEEFVNYPPLVKLRSFVAVAEAASFRKAANNLHLSAPALSAHIRDLEELFGVPLFHRTTRSVTITEDGQRFLARARRLLEELEAGIKELRDHASLQRGRVVVTCMPTIASSLLPDAIADFLERYPSVEIRAFDEIAMPLINRVKNREADFGIGPAPTGADELGFEPLLQDSFVAVFKRGHPLGERKVVNFRDLIKYPLLVLASGTNIRSVIDAAFASEKLTLKPAFEAFHRYTLFGMVEAGLGVALMPEMVIASANRKLHSRRIVKPDMKCEFGIIRRHDHALSPAAARFLEVLKQTAACQS